MALAPSSYDAERVACFSVQAAADPGAMPRVLEVFAKENLTPTRWTSVVEGDGVVIDIQMAGLAAERAEYFARVIRRMPMVASVLTSAKSRVIGGVTNGGSGGLAGAA